MITKTFDPRKNLDVTVGTYDEASKVFYKKVNKKLHFMKIEGGYGIQEDIILKLQGLGCLRIIIDTGGDIYSVDFNEWLQLTPKNYNSGLQRFWRVPIQKEGQSSLL